MIAKLQNPFLAAGLGLLLSVGLGIGLSVRVLEPAIAQAIAARKPKEPTELKQRGWDFWTIEIENLSNELKEERARLKKQAETLDQRAARLAAEEKEFAKLRADVESLRREIAEKVIEISAELVPTGDRLILAVSDNGIGIHEADQRRILEPFTQAAHASTRDHDGLGLGLSISYNIIKDFGGNLSVSDRPGGGAVFRVVLDSAAEVQEAAE